MTKVSVLVPSYNHAQYIEECLTSALEQTLSMFEIVVVDDGSSDNTVEIIRKLAEKHSAIKLFPCEKNLGTYGNLNRGLELCSGDWVAILNSDDIWKRDKLSKQFEAITKSEAQFSVTHGEQIDQCGQVVEHNQHGDWPLNATDFLPYLFFENRILASSLVFRRGVVRFRESLKYSGDWIALIDLAIQGPCAMVSEPLVSWRQHSTNTFKRSPGQVEEEIFVRQEILRFFGHPDSPLKAERLAKNALALSALFSLCNQPLEAANYASRAMRGDTFLPALKRTLALRLAPRLARRALWGSEPAPTLPQIQRRPLWQ